MTTVARLGDMHLECQLLGAPAIDERLRRTMIMIGYVAERILGGCWLRKALLALANFRALPKLDWRKYYFSF